MDDATRTQVILAAVGSAGPVGADKAEWNATVAAQAVSIAVMLGENSDVSKALTKFANAGKPFPAVIVGGRIEASSTRLIVKIRNKDGEEEELRTDRTDSPEGQAMSNIVRSLKGHKVLIWKEIEEFTDSKNQLRKVRVLRHIEDLGADAAPLAAVG